MSGQVSTDARPTTSFRPAEGGVVGVTDHLLHDCGSGAVIEFREGRCMRRPFDGSEPAEVPLPKSAFRLVLARVAAMCHEAAPDYGTPYKGSGLVRTGGVPSGTFRVTFLNTPDEQRLEVRRVDGA